MIKKILIGFALATLAILFLFWLATGGIRKIGDTARGFTNIFGFVSLNATSSGEFRLPWQPAGLIFDPDLSELQDTERTEQDIGDEELNRSHTEYDAHLAETWPETFGKPSPYRGKVQLADGVATEQLASEYVEIEASFNNTGPMGIAGWSLQSMRSGVRAYIPRGTNIFILGDLNEQKDIYLNPGARAIVSSKNSPIGTSFRENTCTGYLTGTQTFTPSLSRNCPPGNTLFSLTSENLRTYGDACFDFTESLPPCVLPLSIPSDITPACRIFLANNLSYNGCVKNNRGRGEFSQDSWRIYLNSGRELWHNSHDVIRLLDSEGRTVDAISY
ncbi:MAG: hypothetical protein AAB947_02030 [Patescibacteria group bacterium]